MEKVMRYFQIVTLGDTKDKSLVLYKQLCRKHWLSCVSTRCR